MTTVLKLKTELQIDEDEFKVQSSISSLCYRLHHCRWQYRTKAGLPGGHAWGDLGQQQVLKGVRQQDKPASHPLPAWHQPPRPGTSRWTHAGVGCSFKRHQSGELAQHEKLPFIPTECLESHHATWVRR